MINVKQLGPKPSTINTTFFLLVIIIVAMITSGSRGPGNERERSALLKHIIGVVLATEQERRHRDLAAVAVVPQRRRGRAGRGRGGRVVRRDGRRGGGPAGGALGDGGG